MTRVPIVLATIVLALSLATSSPAQASDYSDGNVNSAGCPSVTSGGATPAQDPAPAVAPSSIGAPVQALPGTEMPEVDFPIVSQTTHTYMEGGLTHTVGTITRHGIPMTRRTATGQGSHLAAPLSGICTYSGRDVYQRFHTICGGGCLTQWLQRTIDNYSNDADLVNAYRDRIEYRLWWERQYSTGQYFTGNAYTEWSEPVWDCNGANQTRSVSNSFAPTWFTWDRTYDYYWDETWLPTVAAPGGLVMYVSTRTPESFGPDLFTELGLQ